MPRQVFAITHQQQSIREIGALKGYNDTFPPEQLPPGYLADALNCFIRSGEIKKRTGYAIIGNDLGFNTQCQGMKGIRFANGTKEMLGVFNGSIYKWTGSGNWTLITNGSGVLNTTAMVQIVIANNNAYFFDGVSTVPKYDGTSITTVVAIPKGTGAYWFHNILVVWGMSGTPNNAQLSDLGNPENFSTGIATTIGINPNDGDYLVAGVEFNDELLLLKTQNTFSLTGFGTASLTVSNLNNRVPFGTIAPRSVISTGNKVFYISFRGDIPHIRAIQRTAFGVITDGGIVSETIEGTMKGLNKSMLQTVAGVYDGRNAWFAVPNGASTSNNLIVMNDMITGGWVRHQGINASQWDYFTIGSIPEIYFGEAGAFSKGYRLTTDTSDNGTAINFSITTRRYGGDAPEVPKKWKHLYCSPKQSGNYNLTVDYAKDGFSFDNLGTINLGTTGAVFDNIILDLSRLGLTDVTKKRLPIPKAVSYYIQYKMYDTSAVSTISVRDWETVYFPKHIRKIGGN